MFSSPEIRGCEYGDLTPRCQIIREKRHLCYLPENQRLCCVTCPSLADQGARGNKHLRIWYKSYDTNAMQITRRGKGVDEILFSFRNYIILMF